MNKKIVSLKEKLN